MPIKEAAMGREGRSQIEKLSKVNGTFVIGVAQLFLAAGFGVGHVNVQGFMDVVPTPDPHRTRGGLVDLGSNQGPKRQYRDWSALMKTRVMRVGSATVFKQ